MNIDEASQELGKSLAKMMMAEKYDEFTIPDCINILTNARNNAIDLLLHESEKVGKEVIQEEYTRGENQN